jgi:hypothetical protein
MSTINITNKFLIKRNLIVGILGAVNLYWSRWRPHHAHHHHVTKKVARRWKLCVELARPRPHGRLAPMGRPRWPGPHRGGALRQAWARGHTEWAPHAATSGGRWWRKKAEWEHIMISYFRFGKYTSYDFMWSCLFSLLYIIWTFQYFMVLVEYKAREVYVGLEDCWCASGWPREVYMGLDDRLAISHFRFQIYTSYNFMWSTDIYIQLTHVYFPYFLSFELVNMAWCEENNSQPYPLAEY